MSISSVVKMWSRNESNAVVRANFRTMDVTFKEAYQVVCSYDSTVLDVYAAVDPTTGVRMPLRGEPFPGVDTVYAKSVSPKQISPIFWIVDCEYVGEVGPSGDDSPLNSPPVIDFDDIETEEEIDEDFDGYPIINANYEPIEGVRVGIPDLVMNISRNYASYSTYTQAMYRRAVNSDSFFNWPAGTARITKLRARQVNTDTLGYWRVDASIRFRYPYRTTSAKAWYSRMRHQGFYERLTPGGVIVRAVDGNKEPVTKPILLKENGTRETNPNNAYWLEIKKYDSLPFNALGLL